MNASTEATTTAIKRLGDQNMITLQYLLDFYAETMLLWITMVDGSAAKLTATEFTLNSCATTIHLLAALKMNTL